MQEGRKAGRTIGYYQWLVLFMISTEWEGEEDNNEWRGVNKVTPVLTSGAHFLLLTIS